MQAILDIYLIARIASDAHAWNRHVCKHLQPPISIFLPQDHNPWNLRPETFSREVFETDMAAMKKAKAGLILPDYGNDCAFEVGWFHGMGKPVICFTDHDTRWLNDWMVKGGITHVATTNEVTYETIRNDPFLRPPQEVHLLDSIAELNDLILRACDCHAATRKSHSMAS